MRKTTRRQGSKPLSRKAKLQQAHEGAAGVGGGSGLVQRGSPPRFDAETNGMIKLHATPGTDISVDAGEIEAELDMEPVSHEDLDSVRRQISCAIEDAANPILPKSKNDQSDSGNSGSITSSKSKKRGGGFRPFRFLRSKGSRAQHHPVVPTVNETNRTTGNDVSEDVGDVASLSKHSQRQLQSGGKEEVKPKKEDLKLLNRLNEVGSESGEDIVIGSGVVNTVSSTDQNSSERRLVYSSALQRPSASRNDNPTNPSSSHLQVPSTTSIRSPNSNHSVNEVGVEYSYDLFSDDLFSGDDAEQGLELDLSELQQLGTPSGVDPRWRESSDRHGETNKLSVERDPVSSQNGQKMARRTPERQVAQPLTELEAADATRKMVTAAKELQSAKQKASTKPELKGEVGRANKTRRDSTKREEKPQREADHTENGVTGLDAETKREADELQKEDAGAANSETFESEDRQDTTSVIKLSVNPEGSLKPKDSKPHCLSTDSVCSVKNSNSFQTTSSGSAFQDSDKMQTIEHVEIARSTVGDTLNGPVKPSFSTEGGGISFVHVDHAYSSSSSVKLPPRAPSRTPTVNRYMKQQLAKPDTSKECSELKRSQSAQLSLSGESSKGELFHLVLSNDSEKQISRSRSLEIVNAGKPDLQLFQQELELKLLDAGERIVQKTDCEACLLDGSPEEDEIERQISNDDQEELNADRVDDPVNRLTSLLIPSQSTMGFS